MTTEQWALLVAVVALLFSIGIPVWQWLSGNAQKTDSKRTLLLQRIYSAKSTTFISMHELSYFLQKHKSKMEAEQLENLEAMLPRLRKEHDELSLLHEEWSDYKDGRKLNEIEKELSTVNIIETESNDLIKLIENGHRSYETT